MDVYDQYLENYQDPRAPGYAPRERWTRLAAERRDGADLVSGRRGYGMVGGVTEPLLEVNGRTRLVYF